MFPVSETIAGRMPRPRRRVTFVVRCRCGRRIRYQAQTRSDAIAQPKAIVLRSCWLEWMPNTGPSLARPARAFQPGPASADDDRPLGDLGRADHDVGDGLAHPL